MRISISIERAIFAILLFTMPLSAAAQGNLTPPAAPGPTMKIARANRAAHADLVAAVQHYHIPVAYYLAGNLTNTEIWQWHHH